MEFVQAFEMYEDIIKHRKFYQTYGKAHGNYENTINAFDKLLLELDDTMVYGKIRMFAKSRLMTENLLSKDLELRKDFVQRNVLHEQDVNNLTGLITSNVAQNVPTLELFPGTGQFLPFAVASEPLYVVDRFVEIIDDAAKILNNEFYANRRLRKYEIKEFDIEQLPLNSFGLVYCFNEFFYADAGYIFAWAREIYKLLYEGGKFIFNFLPHDEIWAMKYNFNLDFSVIDYKHLITMLLEIGYELENYKIQQSRSSYIVVKKPGASKHRTKIGSCIAEIIDI
jgi:SAM-dependent methyltransferase